MVNSISIYDTAIIGVTSHINFCYNIIDFCFYSHRSLLHMLVVISHFYVQLSFCVSMYIMISYIFCIHQCLNWI